ncbi:hypothetical protein [Methylobacterium sp.]
MLAPDYTEQRSALAKAIGLGWLRRGASAGYEPSRAQSKVQCLRKSA